MQQTVSIELNGKQLTIETGRMAKQADGSCIVRYGDTMVLVTAVASRSQTPKDFFPLTVEYREKYYAAGIIPGGFIKREGRPGDEQVLVARMIDRPIRPLFAEDYMNELQIVATVVSADKENEADVLSIIGASQALMLSGVPFHGPVAGVRIGYKDGEYLINPTNTEIETSDMEMIVAGTAKAVTMVEGFVNKLPEDIVLKGILVAHDEIKRICKIQEELIALVGEKKPFVYQPFAVTPEVLEFIESMSGDKIREANLIKIKLERADFLSGVYADTKAALLEKFPELDPRLVDLAFHEVEKKITRQKFIKEQVRVDGRAFDQVRPITIELGVLPRVHGSALFTRGETQSLVAITLGTAADAQIKDELKGERRKRFMLHYNFPPFSVNEIKQMSSPGRREIGHGMLAERSLTPIIPVEEVFPYTIRVVSEILESNGSSSMASVCGGSLALMDAAVPVSDAISGIAMGLIKEGDDFVILTDIAGLEDHLGDMDFKVAGTKDAITAIQMDIKIEGVTEEIMKRALEQAKKGRTHILNVMNEAMPAPRTVQSPYAPSITMIKIPVEKIGEVIGPAGKMIKAITAETNAEIWIGEDGTTQVSAMNAADAENAIRRIKGIITDAEVGEIVEGTVVKIAEFGAFIAMDNGKQALVHISEISPQRIAKVEDVLKMGDRVTAKIIKIDDMNRINASIKKALPQE